MAQGHTLLLLLSTEADNLRFLETLSSGSTLMSGVKRIYCAYSRHSEKEFTAHIRAVVEKNLLRIFAP
jgi:hypothetical protein